LHSQVEVVEIWGIPIRVHFSWLLVFGLVTWSLAAGYFPHDYPGWAARSYWAVGATTALIFFVSILVHELGHSWVALRNGIPIRGITLFVFGGVAQIAREPGTPGVELRVAIAGPLTSFVLGHRSILSAGSSIRDQPASRWESKLRASRSSSTKGTQDDPTGAARRRHRGGGPAPDEAWAPRLQSGK
jgi:hypothetical protein